MACPALPQSASQISLEAGNGLYRQALAVRDAATERLALAVERLAPLPAEPALPAPLEEARRLAGRIDRRLENLGEAAEALLGAGFPLQPPVTLPADQAAEVSAILAEPKESDPLVIEGWLQGLVRVRAAISDLALAASATQWLTGAERFIHAIFDFSELERDLTFGVRETNGVVVQCPDRDILQRRKGGDAGAAIELELETTGTGIGLEREHAGAVAVGVRHLVTAGQRLDRFSKRRRLVLRKRRCADAKEQQA